MNAPEQLQAGGSVDIYLSYLSEKKKKSGLFDISTLTLFSFNNFIGFLL